MERLRVRPLTSEDLPSMARLVQAEGRNTHADELERFMALEGALAVGVLHDERLVGIVTALRYFEHGWLGPVVLAGGEDAVGLRAALASGIVGMLQRAGVDRIETEATADEVALYGGMGFERVRETLVLERPPSTDDDASKTPRDTVALTQRHLLDIGALDADAAGYGRKEYLWALAQAHPAGARVIESSDGADVIGYALMRRARRGFALGPLVTADNDPQVAERLLRDAIASAPSWPVVTLAPHETPLLAALESAGFARVGALTRMRMGKERAAPERATEWLLGGRLTG